MSSTAEEIDKVLSRAGWYMHHSHGSHVYYRHPKRPWRQVTLPAYPGELISWKTLTSIREQTELTEEEFTNILEEVQRG